MKLIKRNYYLDQLKDVIGTADIKVITGIRRSGKSKILQDFKQYVSQTYPDANIISVDFTLIEYEDLLTYKKLYDYVKQQHVDGVRNFVFIDEVQMCEGFERAINSLHTLEQYDIYVTGSNAFLLASDLSTLFTGRTFEMMVFPFSLAEFMEYYNYTDPYDALDKYIYEGGMSGSYEYNTLKGKYDYIKRVYETLIVRDIRSKHRLRNPHLMDNVSNFMLDNISNITSIRSITATLNVEDKTVSHNTIGSYIDYLCEAFAFYKVDRFDLKGKKYLNSNAKYYLSDHSFRYAQLGCKDINFGRCLENIVAIELMRRGYEIYVGTLQNKEIDFVATTREEALYIQVSDNIDNEETFLRDVSPLLQIDDAYPKIILARTKHDEYQYKGIRIIDIANWLTSGQ